MKQTQDHKLIEETQLEITSQCPFSQLETLIIPDTQKSLECATSLILQEILKVHSLV